MNIGTIVEYIDQKTIICAVIMEVKKQRLRLLTEANKEVNLGVNRLSHVATTSIDINCGRENIAVKLKETAARRAKLVSSIDVKELWELLYGEEEKVSVAAMTEYCFSDFDADHESAIVRAFFKERLYFKFNRDGFTPNSPEKIEIAIKQAQETDRKNKIIESGASWIKKVLKSSDSKQAKLPEDTNKEELIEILKSYYLFEKESKHATLGKSLLAKAGIDFGDQLFYLLVKLGVWHRDENLELFRENIPVSFSVAALEKANQLLKAPETFVSEPNRQDFTDLCVLTIDGQSTLDYDDALSLEKIGDNYILGIHISDVAHFIKRNDTLDKSSFLRGSSIYMPDDKIPMFPDILSDNLCSLKEGNLRPAISTMIKLSRFFEVISYEIVPSTIRIKHQLTYSEANTMINTDSDMATLYKIGQTFRESRLKAGAININLPEINVWLNENKEVTISKIDRESPSRMLVSEIMIMANTLTAKFLADNNLPTIFRSQPEPKTRLYKGDEESIFLNSMQRKQLSRAIIGTEPEHHSGLGVFGYTTATSPIRRYFDLITQRQIRAVLNMEQPYSIDEIKFIIQSLEQTISSVGKIQFTRRRYWILKYLEKMKGLKEQALVLNKVRDFYIVLIEEYMLECKLPGSGINLKPQDHIQVIIQHVNARKNQFSIFMG